MFNLTVADHHNYFVGETGALVHNCPRNRSRGANSRDRRQVEDTAKIKGINDRRGFGDFIEESKVDRGMPPGDTFSFRELLALADEWKQLGGK